MPVLSVVRRDMTELWSLNRPASRNSLIPDVVAALAEALGRAEESGTRTVVLTGEGRSFCAGADLEYLLDCAEQDRSPRPFLQAICDFTVAMESSPIVFVAALHGHAVAGGFELALACDVVIAAQGTLVGDGHVSNNLVPGGGSSVRIESRLGAGHARWLALSGSLIGVEELVPCGWVRTVVPPDSLIPEATRLADTLNSVSFDARTRFKQQLGGDPAAIRTALTGELDVFEDHWMTSDVGAHLRRFLSRDKETTDD